jgi:hypothetical protein
MTISGACPSMVYIQIGAGVENSIITLLGGMAGAICYGLIGWPFIASFLSIGCAKSQKLDDFSAVKSVVAGLAARAQRPSPSSPARPAPLPPT